MKMSKILLCILTIAACFPAYAQVLEKPKIPEHLQDMSKMKIGKSSGAKNVPVRVQSVQFGNVAYNGEQHLAAAVIFTKEIDGATVKQNNNIRLLKQENGFWVDVSTQGNVVRIMPKHITWLSGAAAEAGSYRMHLRGTIKDTDGLYLDCNNDGVGEGGNLPAYDSQIYNVVNTDIEEENSGMLELIQQP